MQISYDGILGIVHLFSTQVKRLQKNYMVNFQYARSDT